MKTADGWQSVRVSSKVKVNHGLAIRVAALNGLAIVMQPEVLVCGDIEAGRLVRLFEDYERPSRPMHIVFLRDDRMSPKLRSFVDFVIERFGARGPH